MRTGYNPLPYIAAGAGAIGMMVLAGHPELIYYTLMVAALYTVVRLGVAWRWIRSQADRGLGRHINRRILGLGAWLLVNGAVGSGLGGCAIAAATRIASPQLSRGISLVGTSA